MYDSEYQDYWQGYSEDGEDIASLIKRMSAMGSNIRSLIMDVQQDIEGNVEEAYSLIEQTAQEIRQEVYLRFEDVDGDIQEAYSRITQTADQIRTEVSNQITAVDGKVDSNTSSISQMADEISSKVSYTDYTGNTIASLINQTATTIKLQASKINLLGQVSFSDLDGQAQGRINNKTDENDVTTIIGGTVTTNFLSSRIAQVQDELRIGSITSGAVKGIRFRNNVGINAYGLEISIEANKLTTPTIEAGGRVESGGGFYDNGTRITNKSTANSAGSHNHGGSTGSAGSHNHGLVNGDQIMLVGGGSRTWSSAPSHSHSISNQSGHTHSLS